MTRPSAPRAVPVAEAMLAIVFADLLLSEPVRPDLAQDDVVRLGGWGDLGRDDQPLRRVVERIQVVAAVELALDEPGQLKHEFEFRAMHIPECE